MRVTLPLAFIVLIGCCSYFAEAEPVLGPGLVGDASLEPQDPGYMLAFPMDEAGMVAAESDPQPQMATLIKQDVLAGPVNPVPETKQIVKSIFPQPSEADRRRKIEEMRKILGLPANIGQKPKQSPIEKPKPLFFPSLMKVLPRLDSSPLSSLPLALIRRSDEEGPKMLQGLLRQAATVFMRRALLEDEPDVQDVSENKGKKDSLLYFLDDDKEDDRKGSKDDNDDEDDDDFSFIPLPRPMLPIPSPFRGGFPTPPFGFPRRSPQMMPRRPSPSQPFPAMGLPPQLRKLSQNEPTLPQGPDQPVMLMLQPFVAPHPMMEPESSVMQPLGLAQPPVFPHPMMLPHPPLPFHPHPFMPPHPMLMMPPNPFMMPPHPMMMPPHPMMLPPHPMMLPPHPMMMPPHPMMMPPHPMMTPPHPMMVPPHPPPFFMEPHPHLLPHPTPFFMEPHHQLLLSPNLPPHHPMFSPHQLPPQQAHFNTGSPETQGEPEESPLVVLMEDSQPRLHHQHHHSQSQQQQQQELQVPPQFQGNARSMNAILSPLRRMQMLRELIMARSLQMSPRAAFHAPVFPRMSQGEREVAQSIFRPIFAPFG